MSEQLENEIVASAAPKKPTPPRNRTVKSLQDVQLPDADDSADKREVALDNADRKAIDDIVLSNDVSKGGKIRITRKGPFDHTFQYITTIPADSWDTEVSFEYIKKMYGGGDYKCQTFRANGQMYKPFEFAIDYRVKGQLDEDQIKLNAIEQQSGGKSTSGADMLKMFELFRPTQQQDQLKSSDLIKIMEMGSQKSDQMMMMMMQMMNKSSENMVQMMTVMMTANAQKGNGIDPVILQMLQAKQEKTPVIELLEMMKAVKELNAPSEDKEPEKPFWERLLTTAAPALIGGLTGSMSQPQAQSQPVAPEPQQTQQLDQPTADMLNNYLVRIFLNKVLEAAVAKKDPLFYADMIAETLSEEQFQMLRNVLTQADWTVKLFGQDQRVQGCMAWLNELKTIILTDELPPEQSSPAQGGSSTVQSEQ